MLKAILSNNDRYIRNLASKEIYMKPDDYARCFCIDPEGNMISTMQGNYLEDKNNKNIRRVWAVINYQDEDYYLSNLHGNNYYFFKASEVTLESGGVIKALLVHFYQALKAFTTKKVVAFYD